MPGKQASRGSQSGRKKKSARRTATTRTGRKPAAKKKSTGTKVKKKTAAKNRKTATKAKKKSAAQTKSKRSLAKATSKKAAKKKSAQKSVSVRKTGKKIGTLGRPRLSGDSKLDDVFRNDYQAREIFVFLGVETLRELEEHKPNEIIEALTGPMTQTVQRIRKALAMHNRCLAGDRKFALAFKKALAKDD